MNKHVKQTWINCIRRFKYPQGSLLQTLQLAALANGVDREWDYLVQWTGCSTRKAADILEEDLKYWTKGTGTWQLKFISPEDTIAWIEANL